METNENINFEKPLKSKFHFSIALVPLLAVPAIIIALTISTISNQQLAIGWHILISTILTTLVWLFLRKAITSITLYPDRIEIFNLSNKPSAIIPFSDIIYHSKFLERYGKRRALRRVFEVHTKTKGYKFNEHTFKNIDELYEYLEHHLPKMDIPDIVIARKNFKYRLLGVLLVAIGIFFSIGACATGNIQQPAILVFITLIIGAGIALIVIGKSNTEVES